MAGRLRATASDRKLACRLLTAVCCLFLSVFALGAEPPEPDLGLKISLPHSFEADLRNDRKEVSVSGPFGRILVHSGTGGIEIDEAGAEVLSIRSSSGDVTIGIDGLVPPLDVETLTGSIELRVTGQPGLEVDLATSGEITVDFSIEVDYRYHEEPAKFGTLTLGDGQSHIRLRSRQGAIRILGASDSVANEPPQSGGQDE